MLKRMLLAILLVTGMTLMGPSGTGRADDMDDVVGVECDDSFATNCQERGWRRQIVKKIVKATPSTNREAFRNIKNSPALEHKGNGSVWEKDITRHGGAQYKHWKNRKDWENRVKPSSVWPNGDVRK